MQEPVKKICDNCVNYRWYYDKCLKYNCEVDARSTCSCHESENKGDTKHENDN